MNKQDYLHQVDAQAPSPALRAKIAAMAPRARRPRPRLLAGRWDMKTHPFVK